MAIDVGKEIISFIPGEMESGVRFEIGYAFLRSGKIKEAIHYLEVATRLEPTPEHHYWLGEAYFSKGDLVRALYRYQKITNDFSDDKMWSPIAQYKTGIVLEFMEEFDEAKKIYNEIIEDRGLGDIWGAEAQKRLEELE